MGTRSQRVWVEKGILCHSWLTEQGLCSLGLKLLSGTQAGDSISDRDTEKGDTDLGS